MPRQKLVTRQVALMHNPVLLSPLCFQVGERCKEKRNSKEYRKHWLPHTAQRNIFVVSHPGTSTYKGEISGPVDGTIMPGEQLSTSPSWYQATVSQLPHRL